MDSRKSGASLWKGKVLLRELVKKSALKNVLRAKLKKLRKVVCTPRVWGGWLIKDETMDFVVDSRCVSCSKCVCVGWVVLPAVYTLE